MADNLIHPGPIDNSLLVEQGQHRSQAIWSGEDLGVLKLRTYNHYSIVSKNNPPCNLVWEKILAAGFASVFRVGSLVHDPNLITAFTERWRTETHTFHINGGEVTITLEDVEVILGLNTCGRPVTCTDDGKSSIEWCEYIEQYLGIRPVPNDDVLKGKIKCKWLMENFPPIDFNHMELENAEQIINYHSRANLLLLIGSLFTDSGQGRVKLWYLQLLEDLNTVHEYSWGSAVLAFLYRQLCRASRPDAKDIGGCLTLLQCWIWERFPIFTPEILHPTPIPPRAYRWTSSRLRFTAVGSGSLLQYRYSLDNLPEQTFNWMPYLSETNTDVQRALGYCSRCPLICLEIVEWYYPDRVLRQFGFCQNLPTNPEHIQAQLHLVVRRGARENWMDRHQPFLDMWNNRTPISVNSNIYPIVTTTIDYMSWYRCVTRRLLIRPQHPSALQQPYHGTMGYFPYLAEGLAQTYHQAHMGPDTIRDLAETHLTQSGYQHLVQFPPADPTSTPNIQMTRRRAPRGRRQRGDTGTSAGCSSTFPHNEDN